MPAPAAAAGAAAGGGGAAGGGAAGGSSAGGSAGAKAAGGNAAKQQGMSRAMSQGGGQGEQGGEERQDEAAFDLSNPPNVNADIHSSLKLLIFGGGLFLFLVLILPMMWLNAAQSQCLFNPANSYGTSAGSLGGVQGTGVTPAELKLIRSHPYAGNKVTPGTYSGTVYGPPWPLLAGTPDTSTGLELGSPNHGKKKYIVAMDPQLNNYGAFVYVWPNPHNWTGPFIVADTGQGRSDGIDFWEWRGMDQMEKWGRRNVKVSDSPIKQPPSSSGSVATTGGAGYGYPLAETGEMGGGVADHMARPFGNWMSDNAVDILVPKNTRVLAVGDGRITRLSGSSPNPCANPAGYTIYMRSGGHEFAYMHLNRMDVRAGQRVRKGDVIGLSGTANCVEHLHFAAQGMNPEDIVQGGSASGGAAVVDVQLLKRKFGIPTDLPPIYIAAAEKYNLGPKGASILAAINRIETNFGELANDTSYAGAQGWMQFMPATWAAYGVDGNGDGVKDPTNKFDAIYAAANYLSASGAPGNWHDAIWAYNHAEWYVQDVLEWAAKYYPYLQGGMGTESDCGETSLTGPANLQEAVTLTSPRKWVPIPAAIGDTDEVIDARLLPAATWISKTYNLHITQGGWQPGSPSVSHGWGTALDMVPKNGKSWDETALRLAKDLGWTPECASSGEKPACDLVPAIYDVYYNGFPGHGDPAHAGASAHIHIQFECSCSGGGQSQNIASWVKSFPIGEEPEQEPPKSDRPKKNKGKKT